MDELDEMLVVNVKEYIKSNANEVINAVLNEISKAYVKGFDDGANYILNLEEDDNDEEV